MSKFLGRNADLNLHRVSQQSEADSLKRAAISCGKRKGFSCYE